MKIFSALKRVFNRPRKASLSVEDYKQEALVILGKAQFEKLLQRGLQVPIALL